MTTNEDPKVARFVFAVFGSESNDALAKLVEANIAEKDRFQLPSGDWLIADDSSQTSKLFEKIKQGSEDESVAMIVTRADRVYGWHDSAIWDWIEDARNGRN